MPFKKLIFITTHEIYSTHPQSSPDLHCFKAAVLDYIDLIQRIWGSFVSYFYMRDDCNSAIVIGRTVCFLYFFWPCFHKTGAGRLFLQLFHQFYKHGDQIIMAIFNFTYTSPCPCLWNRTLLPIRMTLSNDINIERHQYSYSSGPLSGYSEVRLRIAGTKSTSSIQTKGIFN